MSEIHPGAGGQRNVPPAPQPGVVLIAEDEAPIAEMVALVVEGAGYRPLVVGHGDQAREMVRRQRPVLVITDLMMPHMDGAELISAVRADAVANGHAPPPIILMTAAGWRRAQTAGADIILRKPFEVSELEALLHRVLGPSPKRPGMPGQ